MRMVNVQFGGKISIGWPTLTAAIETYRAIADQYSLVMPRGGFVPIFETGTDNLIGLQVRWVREELPESNLQAFNELWYTISVQYSIERHESVLGYYVVEE